MRINLSLCSTLLSAMVLMAQCSKTPAPVHYNPQAAGKTSALMWTEDQPLDTKVYGADSFPTDSTPPLVNRQAALSGIKELASIAESRDLARALMGTVDYMEVRRSNGDPVSCNRTKVKQLEYLRENETSGRYVMQAINTDRDFLFRERFRI